MIRLIKCKGRYSVRGKIECVDKFEHIGDFGDKELVIHQEKEKSTDTKHDWWTGYDTDDKFTQLKETFDHALQKATITQESD